MAYLLDADTFITAANLHYCMDFCPAYWEWLLRENQAGHVYSVAKVLGEVAGRPDRVGLWAKKEGKALFLPLDVETSTKMVEVSNFVNSMGHPTSEVHKKAFLDGGDAILVSCALAYGHTVVTLEKEVAKDPHFTKVKLPNICKEFGVSCTSPYDMLRALGANFGLLPRKQIATIDPVATITEGMEEEESDEEDY